MHKSLVFGISYKHPQEGKKCLRCMGTSCSIYYLWSPEDNIVYEQGRRTFTYTRMHGVSPYHHRLMVTCATSRSGNLGEIVLNFNFRDTYKFPQSTAENYGPGI